MDHPKRSVLGPDEIISVAEANGLILLLGEWMRHEVSLQISAWMNKGLPLVPVTIGISKAEFRRAELIDRITSATENACIHPSLLDLEFGEDVIADRTDYAAALIQQLCEAGFQVSIGAFAVNNGSRACLSKVPANRVNIEQHLTKDILRSPRCAAIAKSIVDVANNLGLTVVAKGMETEAQFSFFRKAGCDEVQGDYFSPPLTADQFVSWHLRSGLYAPAIHESQRLKQTAV